jgi:curved DNA-binding protein CbpA
MTARDPYEVLGVPQDASDRTIREAYYTHARRAHPDLVGTAGLDMMRALNEAWAILKDPERRALHDAEHGAPAPASAKPEAEATPAPKASGWSKKAGDPEWTGAAGRPPGRAWGHVLDFGIYAGWSLGEVARRDRGYLMWLRDRQEGKKFTKEIDQLLEPSGGDGGQSGSGDRGNRGR